MFHTNRMFFILFSLYSIPKFCPNEKVLILQTLFYVFVKHSQKIEYKWKK